MHRMHAHAHMHTCPVGEWTWVHQKKYVEMKMADARNMVMAVVKWETADASHGKFVGLTPLHT